MLAQAISSSIFLFGYMFIVFETINHKIRKEAVAVLMAFGIWFTLFATNLHSLIDYKLQESISDIFQILFFLIGAITIVEYTDSKRGFDSIISYLTSCKNQTMLMAISVLAFFMSSVLDNMTTCIVLSVLLKKIVVNRDQRWYAMSLVLLLVNIGGAFTPIGDITTTMLWINQKITTVSIIKSLFLPCITSAIIAYALVNYKMKAIGGIKIKVAEKTGKKASSLPLIISSGALLSVPLLKSLFHIPPFLTILASIGVIWMIDFFILHEDEKSIESTMCAQLKKSNLMPILFFYGILLAISGLEVAGVLDIVSAKLTSTISSSLIINFIVGILSAVVDNVPLVASMSKMFSYAIDDTFWSMLAYGAGVGGNILIIGSAAGIALLSIENISLGWYVRNISWIAFISYLAGFGVISLQNMII